MTKSNDQFLTKLLATFRIEADEHIRAMSSGLVELESLPAGEQRSKLLERVYRDAHSLKGAARAVSMAEMESVCHALESVFDGLKGNRVSVTPALFDLLHEAIELLDALRAADGPANAGAGKQAAVALIRRLDAARQGAPLAGHDGLPLAFPVPADQPLSPDPAAAWSPSSDRGAATIRVRTEKLDAVMRQTEELLAPRLAAGARAHELSDVGAMLAGWKKALEKTGPVVRAVRRTLGDEAGAAAMASPALTQMLEYLDAEPQLMKVLEDRLSMLAKHAAHDHRALSALVDGLLHDVKEMHMLPFSSLLETYPRLARELAREQGKQVELAIRGGDIEIDRRILEQMKDPLTHLFRNCVDHGVERPEARERRGKPAHATLTVEVAQRNGNEVEILVADDGTGIEVAKVRAAAERLGLMSGEALGDLTEDETLALVFQSGVSTSPIVTDLSGRGLGLAIVRERVEALGGTIALETQPGKGTSFRIGLPLTVATFRGVLVRVADRTFIIPAVSVERVALVAAREFRTVENRETIILDGHALSLVRLGDVLEIPRTSGDATEHATVVVLGPGGGRIAFQVDAVLAEQEVLVKALGPQLTRVRNVSGASVLGTGQVVPVLNVSDLLQSAMRTAAGPPVAMSGEEHAAAQKPAILVAEDSITSRALLKNILESAGYDVATAVDGVDAYTMLKTRTFSLLVSDVEMPRMDGFDLTAKLRSDQQLAHLPVVLVTALELREHRERGIDVGANAYIVKSSFDQSNLLEIIRRLL